MRIDLGRSAGVITAIQLLWLTGLRSHLPTPRNSRVIKRTHIKIVNGVGSTCIHKGHLNKSFHILTRLAQLAQHHTSDLMAVGSIPTVRKNFLFCIFSLSMCSWQVDWCHTNEIKHEIHPRYIGAQREWSFERKMAAALGPSTRVFKECIVALSNQSHSLSQWLS